jgi:release factor glutamine methyltransferase
LGTLAAWLKDAAARLHAAGVDDGRLEARLLLGATTGWSTERMLAHAPAPLDPAFETAANRLLARRAAREPMSHILGWREFWSLRFAVTSDVLTPRPDSETLVEAALAGVADRSAALRVLDLGVGSGCLLLTLLHELPKASGVGIDASPTALAVARLNARALGLAGRADLRLGDWAAGLVGPFDLIVSNPPYIPSAEIDTLEPEVALHEPRTALDGGPDGLAPYRTIMGQAAQLLSPGGRLLVEVGVGQAAHVAALATCAALKPLSIHRDLAAIERVVEVVSA